MSTQYVRYPGSGGGDASAGNQLVEIAKLTSIDNKTPPQGQATAANSSPVVLASDQPALPLSPNAATASNQATEISSLSSIDGKLTGVSTAANQATAQASLSSIDTKLTDNATATLQSTGNASLSSIDTKTPVLGQALAAASVPVVLTAAQLSTLTPLSTVAITAASLPLPAGAATSALQTTISGQLPATLGQKTSANSLAVTLASDTGVLTAKTGGKASANTPVRNDYTSTAVTTAAYVQLVASTTLAITELEIFDSSGQTLQLAVGAPGSEVVQMLIFPGGNGRVPLAIPAASRIAIRALSANASVGEIDINFYS